MQRRINPIPHLCLQAACLLLAGCVLPVLIPPAELETPRLTEQGQEYYHMVNRLKAENFDIDFHALRMAWTQTPLYFTSNREKAALREAYRAEAIGNYHLCLEKAGEALSYNYTSMVAHNWASKCAHAEHRPKTAAFHRSILDNLLYSVLASGDGTTPQTAWKVSGASEVSGMLLLLSLRLEDIRLDAEHRTLMRIRAWDYLEGRERVFWADYSIPLKRYESLGLSEQLDLPATVAE